MKPTKWDLRFLQMAELVSTWSKDPSTKTGAAIAAPDNSVLSVGFNGFPQGMPDDMSLYEDRDEKYSRIVHCEVNALLHVHGAVPIGSTLYTYPFISCDRCVVQMLQAGLRRFVAPACVDPDKLARWGDAFRRTKRYISECGGQLIEV
jgi:dCMP deaminase